MKKANKLLMAALIAVIIPLVGQAEANVDVDSLKARLQELRGKHTEYKAQVVAGEMTRDEAIGMWRTELEAFRTEKDRFFQNKMEELREKYEQLAEKHPGKAAEIRARFQEKKQQREQRKAEIGNLLGQKRAGQITREEFVEALRMRRPGRNKGVPEPPPPPTQPETGQDN